MQWQGEPSIYLVSHHGGEKYNPIHVNFVNFQIRAMHLYQGIRMCLQCSGECVIWQESVDEQPWEKVRSSSPLKVKEDDEVDKLEININNPKRSKRTYASPSPEVAMKISRSLRDCLLST